MASTSTGPLLRQLRGIASDKNSIGVADSELLHLFVQHRDEIAFELLVRRYQRLVLGVCQRMLGNNHDAEDAFQAAFLALVRKATSIRRRDSVASWLHTIAYRIALRVRMAKRPSSDGDLVGVASLRNPATEAMHRELAGVLDEEVSQLPAKYRVGVVLCYLEGKTYREAARLLGLPVGTLSARLTQARTLLRKRLVRRGIDASVALLGAFLSERAAPGATHAFLVAGTVKAAAALATNRSTGAISATVMELTNTALRSMLLSKLRIVLLGLCSAAVVLGTGFLVSAGLVRPEVIADSEPPGKPSGEAHAKPARVDHSGDPLPAGAIRRLGSQRFRHGGGTIQNLLLSSDGKTLVSNTYYGDRKIYAWEMATGKLLRAFPGTWEVNNFAVSPDGAILATGQQEEVVLWNLDSGKEIRRLAQADASGVAFSPDGKTLAAAGFSPDICLWDLSSGKTIARFHWKRTGTVQLAFTPDGKTLLAGTQYESRIDRWDVATGSQQSGLDAKVESMYCFSLSSDGTKLATGSNAGSVPIWNVRTGQIDRRLQLERGDICFQVAFSPDAKTLATGLMNAKYDFCLALWDVETGKEIRRFPGVVASGKNIAYSRDGKTLIFGTGGAIRLWDLSAGKETGPTANLPRDVGQVTVAPDGRSLAYGRDRDICFVDLVSGRETGANVALRFGVQSCAFAPDCKTVVTGGSQYAVDQWEVKSGKLLCQFQWDKKEFPGAHYANGVAFSPDGRTLAAGESGGRDRAFIRFWDLATSKEIRRIPLVGMLNASIAFSPDGDLIVAAGRTGDDSSKVGIWDTASGKELPRRSVAMNDQARGDKPRGGDLFEQKIIIPRMVFSPDGKMLAKNGRQKTIAIWEASTCQQRLLLTGHTESTFCVAFAPDSRTLASTSWDETIRLWDLDTGVELRKLTGHRGPVNSVAFAEGGKLLVSAGDDSTVVFWDVADVTHRNAARKAPLTRKEWNALWEDLARPDAAEAYRAIVRMTADAPATVAALKAHLHPARSADAARLAGLIKDLDDDRYAVRLAAASELEKLADLAGPTLERTLADGKATPEAHRQLEALQASLAEISGERLRYVRAIEVLERLRTPQARQVLTTLADGAPAAFITKEAKAAVRRMDK